MLKKVKIYHILLLTLTIFIQFFDVEELNAQLNAEQQELIKQYSQKIKDYKASNQLKEAANYSNKRAFIYLGAGKYEDAISSYIESTELNIRIGNDVDNKKIYNNIAMIYAEMNQMNNSIKYFEKSLMISRRNNNKNEIAVSLMDISTILMYNKEYEKAIIYLEEALKISNDMDNMNALISCYDLLAKSENAIGNKERSEEYYKQYLVLDKLRSEGKKSIANQSNNFLAAESENLNKYVPVDREQNSSKYSLNKEEKQNLGKNKDLLNTNITVAKEEQKRLLEEKKKFESIHVREKIQYETVIARQGQTILYLLLALIMVSVIMIGVGTYLLLSKKREIKRLKGKLIEFEEINT